VTAPRTIPTAEVSAHADTNGLITLMRLANWNAVLEPETRVSEAERGCCIAWIGYELPGSPGRHEMPVTLSVQPRENA
jgi:hypothetical protein